MKWTLGFSTQDGIWDHLYFHNGIWMAGNSSDAGIYRSIDGKTWTPCAGTSASRISALYGANGMWVAYGDEPWYSTDNGVTWTVCIGTTYFSKSLCSANGIWVGGGTEGIVYSNDGKSWMASNVKSGIVTNIYFANGIFIASMSKNLLWSTDCKTWTSCTINSSGNTPQGWNKVENHGGIWVALSSSGGAYYSTDGKSWTRSDFAAGYCYNILAYGNGTWAFSVNPSMGWNGVYYSTNGKNWIQSDLNIACTALHYSNGLWIAATGTSDVYYSYNAKHWVKCADKTGGALATICSANGILVAGASLGEIYYSPTWEPTIPAGDYMFSAAPGSPAFNPTELGNVTLTETINFVSNDETHSTMTAKHIHS